LATRRVQLMPSLSRWGWFSYLEPRHSSQPFDKRHKARHEAANIVTTKRLFHLDGLVRYTMRVRRRPRELPARTRMGTGTASRSSGCM
jgi:hypothetical protein